MDITTSQALLDDYKIVKASVDGKTVKVTHWMKCHTAKKIKHSYSWINKEFYDLSWKDFIEQLEKKLNSSTIKEVTNKNIKFLDKKTRKVSWRKLVKHAQSSTELMDEMKISQRMAKIHIDTNADQIALVFTADWHLGSSSVDYNTFLRNMEYIIDTPNLYMCIVGDERDNFNPGFKSKSAVLQQVLHPEQQILLLKDIMQELEDKGKVLFSCWDNHSEIFDEMSMGYSIQKTFIKGQKSVFFDGEGIVDLKIGDATFPYYLMAIHKTRFNSFLNALHGAKRMFNYRFPANILVTAHTHDGTAMELYPMYREAEMLGLPIGGDNYLIKTGTYKVNDSYALRHFGSPIIGNPTLVLRSDFKSIDFFTDPVKAVTFMNSKYTPGKGR